MKIQPDSKLKRRVITTRRLAYYEQLESSISFFLDVVKFKDRKLIPFLYLSSYLSFFYFSTFIFFYFFYFFSYFGPNKEKQYNSIYLSYARSTHLEDTFL